MAFDIYLSPPHLCGEEARQVEQALKSNWVAPSGPAVTRFEEEMAAYAGVNGALAVSSGTAAIHLALRWFGVGTGDVVFCSDLTFAGSCNPILYQGAQPVFIDSEPETLNMSPKALTKALEWAQGKGQLPKAVIIVDLYGESADWGALLPICRRYRVPVIEDAAEAVGTVRGSRRCGSFGDLSVYSFNGNKILTTSGGGMVLGDDPAALKKMRFWATQAREDCLHYEHREWGYNYRMSNICAAIGLGQLAFLKEKLALRRGIHHRYSVELPGIRPHGPGSNCWMTLLTLKDVEVTPSQVVLSLMETGIEARPAWKPMHLQPVFRDAPFFSYGEASISEQVFQSSLCLPSGDGMTPSQQRAVIHAVRSAILGEGRQAAVV